MPRTDSSGDRGGCTLCNNAPRDGVMLLECLACLREGHDHRENAFCNGTCFQRHWTIHRDRSFG